jgi:S-adenosylmethionine uptake transporter
LSRPASLSGKGALFVIVSGIAATIGQVLLTYAYQRGHTMLVSLLGYSRVVFTALLGLAIWGYRPTLAAWLGMILVVASGAMATFSVRDAPALPHAETCSRSPARIL